MLLGSHVFFRKSFFLTCLTSGDKIARPYTAKFIPHRGVDEDSGNVLRDVRVV
jgi:hypothetical protein